MDPSVITALTAAVDAAPQNVALRLHLAECLAAAGRQDEAIEHVRLVLELEPVNVAALRLGTDLAQATGDEVWAATWARMSEALGTPAPVPATPVATDIDTATSELDAFLEDVLGVDSTKAITLADVAGLEDVKKRIHSSFLAPMRNDALREAYKKSLRGGLLLYGPPGCGKTFIARAVAGELGAQFYSIGLNDILEMWMGNSQRNLHKVFETARRRSPCVLFFDELDALGFKRGNLTHSSMRNVVAQLLTELDSLGGDNDGVFILGATNTPWDIDPALRRPGRFDRTLLVLPPDAKARKAILQYHLQDRPTHELDLSAVVASTDGFSGADLRLVCESATELAMNEAIHSGSLVPIRDQHLTAARASVQPSIRPWFETANNYAMFANSSGEYDELLAYIKKKRLA